MSDMQLLGIQFILLWGFILIVFAAIDVRWRRWRNSRRMNRRPRSTTGIMQDWVSRNRRIS
jgi:hypothetical protein